jgi:ubiquinone/menaquinone biosynthesis C-methylase UbiE
MNYFDYDNSHVPKIYTESRGLPAETLRTWLHAIGDQVAGPIDGIVDLGCGTGRFSKALAEFFDTYCMGVEPSAEMLAEVKRNASENTRFIRGTAEQIPIDEQVDMVFMSMVYHHVKNQKKALKEIRRVLKVPGHLVIRNATAEDIANNELFDFFPRAREIELKRLPKAEVLAEQIRSAGFRTVCVKPITQVFAHSYEEYFDKVKKRGLSALQMIEDKEFDQGITALRRYCNSKSPNEAVHENFHLFVFSNQL